MFVCGARGSGNDTDIGEAEVSPLLKSRLATPFSSVVAMLCAMSSCFGVLLAGG